MCIRDRLWCIIGRVPITTVVNDVFAKSVESYGATIAIIVVGAWLGRVRVDTGIAGYIIKKTVELAGDKPLLTTLLLNFVCALIFCSAFGVGSVMAIGMIVLPIDVYKRQPAPGAAPRRPGCPPRPRPGRPAGPPRWGAGARCV